jgi:hypothetical protein
VCGCDVGETHENRSVCARDIQDQRESNTDQNHRQQAGLLGYTTSGNERK